MGYVIDTSQDIWRVTFSGTLTNDDLREVFVEAAKIEQAMPAACNRLVDLRQLDSINIGFSDLSHFAGVRRGQKLSNSVRSALVVKNLVQYGIARMFQTLLDHPQIEVQVFYEENEAVAWLFSPNRCEAQL